MAKRKSKTETEKLKKLHSIIGRLTQKFSPDVIQLALSKVYAEYVLRVEPDYIYKPKEKRKEGEKFEEPSTAEGRYWLRVYLASLRLSGGMQTWLYDMMEDVEEEGEE